MGKRKEPASYNDVSPMEIDWDASWDVPPKPKRARKTYIPKALKIAVWDTYIGKDIGCTKCSICKTIEITQMDFHCGHIIAEADGGETCLSNLKPICAKCNLSMGKKNLEKFKDKYFH